MGSNQSIQGIYIENNNLLFFSSTNSAGSFSPNGEFMKVFKTALQSLNNSEINLTNPGDINFSIIEPLTDSTTTNYPKLFTRVKNSSKVLYNTKLTDNNTLIDIVTGGRYNMMSWKNRSRK